MNKKSMILAVGALCFSSFLFGAVSSVVIRAQNEPKTTSSTITFPTFYFSKNLKLGDNNQDVKQLQILLNSDVDTQITTTGTGSVGKESTYFGILTAQAVTRFQKKNTISPTGFVGPLTREKLNIIVTNSSKIASTSSATLLTGPKPLTKEPLPRLYTIRPQQVKKGDVVTLVGAGFQVDNTIYIGQTAFYHISPQDSSNISFKIPTDMQNGTYAVRVENNQGSSQIIGQDIDIYVTDSPQSGPVISSVTPTSVSLDDSIVVTGSGFAFSGNSIISGFGTIENVQSNGAQITFSARSLINPDIIKKMPVGSSYKLDFYVVNPDTGASNIPGSVVLKI